MVENLSLTIPRGCVYGLIGPNGVGKSTTLKSMMRFLKTSGGQIKVLGHDVATQFQSVKHRIGYVPELHQIYRWMRVKRVIEFARSFYPSWNERICNEMLDMFDLDPSKKVKQLSKGMLAKRYRDKKFQIIGVYGTSDEAEMRRLISSGAVQWPCLFYHPGAPPGRQGFADEI